MNKYQEAFESIILDKRKFGHYICDGYRNDIGVVYELISKQEKYRWHDLRKDPKDLPETEMSVILCFIDNSEKNGKYLYSIGYLDDNLEWDWLGNHERYLEIIGWKYIEELA